MNSTVTNSTSLDFSIFTILNISIHGVYFLLGLPLNIYIIFLLFPSRGVMDAADVFSWNQAISEIFFVLVAPFQCLCCMNLNLCLFEALGFFLGICFSSRCLFQCCVCLERYLAVVHPVTFLRYKPLRYRVACSITVWICSLAMGIICSCMFHNLLYKLFTVISILVLIFDNFCCVSILRKLRHPRPRDTESDVSEMNAVKKKAFQVVFINLLTFLFQMTPIAVIFGIQSILSAYAFGVATVIGLAINTAVGLLQTVYVLHKAGKLPLIPSEPFSSCCMCSGQG